MSFFLEAVDSQQARFGCASNGCASYGCASTGCAYLRPSTSSEQMLESCDESFHVLFGSALKKSWFSLCRNYFLDLLTPWPLEVKLRFVLNSFGCQARSALLYLGIYRERGVSIVLHHWMNQKGQHESWPLIGWAVTALTHRSSSCIFIITWAQKVIRSFRDVLIICILSIGTISWFNRFIIIIIMLVYD